MSIKKEMSRDRLALCSVLLGSLLVAGCTVEPPSHDGREAIEQVLRDSIGSNEKFIKPGKLVSVEERALTPEIDISLGKTHSRVSNEPRFDVVVNNVSARDFFTGLVKDTKYNIMVDPEIKGFVTLNLRQVTVPQVMEAVRDGYGYEFEETAYGFRVFPSKLETKVFKLNYIDVSRSGNSYTVLSAGQQISSSKGDSNGNSSNSDSSTMASSINTESDGKFWEVLKQNLDALVSASQDKGAVVVVNPKAGMVIVKAYPNELRAIERYINKVQTIIQRQVIIEAKIIEVELNAAFRTGINWKMLGAYQIAPSGDAWIFNGGLRARATGGSQFEAAINLLNHQGSVNVLSSPRVATLNNQKAVIKVGKDRFFMTKAGSNVSTGGGGMNTASDTEMKPFFSGISLDVTPQIDEHENVTIHIHPIVSKVSDDNRTFVVDGKQQTWPLALSEVRETDTVVRAKSGQVIVIGGLMKSESSMEDASVPGLEKIPVVNGVSKSTSRDSGKFELVILLRPIIASNANWHKQLKEAAISITKMERDGDYRYDMRYAKDVMKAR